jgi:proline racemase
MEKRCDWLSRHATDLRTVAMLEPRGSLDLVGALLTEPVTPGADAGLIGMDGYGYGGITAPGVVAAVTLALERGLLVKAPTADGDGQQVSLVLDTPAGVVQAQATLAPQEGPARVIRLTLSTPHAWVVRAGHDVRLGERRLRVDLAWAGALYAVLDGEAAGLPLTPERLADLRRLGQALSESVVVPNVTLPTSGTRLAGVVFTGPPRAEHAHLRLAFVSADGVCDRSGLSGAPAVVSLLHGMGLAGPGDPVVFESVHGLTAQARIQRVVAREDDQAVDAVITASAWITGETTLIVSDSDPLGHDA